jgi:methyl-accepting chemotaxis protein
MPDLLRGTSPTIKLIVVTGAVAGILFAGFGVWLVYLGSSGETRFAFFGQQFASRNVGIAAIFIGAAVLVLLTRRALKTFDHSIAAEAAAGDGHEQAEWPFTKTLQTLTDKLDRTSEENRAIIRLVAGAARPVYVGKVVEAMNTERAQVIYRARDLQSQQLIEIVVLTDTAFKLHPAVLAILGRNASRKLRAALPE